MCVLSTPLIRNLYTNVLRWLSLWLSVWGLSFLAFIAFFLLGPIADLMVLLPVLGT